jgi:GntR family phosphonate transport system transcriptional regulator
LSLHHPTADQRASRLDRGDGIALWRQIERRLADEIEQGVFAAGARLPTEAELAKRFQVNRHTVRRALATLADRGLIRVEQGRGTFVREDVLDYALSKRTRFSANMQALNRRPGGRLLRALVMRAEPHIAEELDLPAGAPVLLIETVGEVDDTPISVAAHYFDAQRFPGLIDAYEKTGSLTQALRLCGLPDYTRQRTRVSARLPEAAEADVLQMPRTRPILVSESLNVDPDGRPCEYGLARFAAHRVQILVET